MAVDEQIAKILGKTYDTEADFRVLLAPSECKIKVSKEAIFCAVPPRRV